MGVIQTTMVTGINLEEILWHYAVDLFLFHVSSSFSGPSVVFYDDLFPSFLSLFIGIFLYEVLSFLPHLCTYSFVYLFQYGFVDIWFFLWIMIQSYNYYYFQTVLTLASGTSLRGPLYFSVYGFLGPSLTSRHHRVLELALGFPAPALESAMSTGALIPVTKERGITAKVWEWSVLLLLGHQCVWACPVTELGSMCPCPAGPWMAWLWTV